MKFSKVLEEKRKKVKEITYIPKSYLFCDERKMTEQLMYKTIHIYPRTTDAR